MPLDNKIDETNIDQLVADSKQITAWRLFPYSDGRFAFYPGGSLMKGYILTREQAVSLFTDIEKKGMSLTQLLVLGGAGSFIGVSLSNLDEQFGFKSFINSGWFIVFLLFFAAVIVLFSFVDCHDKSKKFKIRFGDLPVCQHFFPKDYYRLKALTVRVYSIWILWLFLILFGLFTALALFIYLHGIFIPTETPMPFVGVFVLVLLGLDGLVLRILYFQLKLKNYYGRSPDTSDLRPLDPVTGKMPQNPFGE